MRPPAVNLTLTNVPGVKLQLTVGGRGGPLADLRVYAVGPPDHRSFRSRAAFASSRRLTGVVTGASCRRSGVSAASDATCSIAWAKASRVSLVSVSVGSTIIASSTTRGKYTVEGWKP